MSNAEKTIIVTGANTGIGYDATCKLLAAGYEVVMACRSRQNAETAIAEIHKANKDAKVTFMQLDLADLSTVPKFVEEFHASKKDLFGLLNNAGLTMNFNDREKKTTKDGFELTMGTNHLGHFLLTTLLLDDLKKAAQKFGSAHVINVASTLHYVEEANNAAKRMDKTIEVTEMNLDDLMYEIKGRYNGIQAYKDSKAANVMFTLALARRLQGTGVKVNAVCPGFVPGTGLGRQGSAGAQFFMRHIVGGLFRLFKPDVIKTVHEAGAMVTSPILATGALAEADAAFISHGAVKESSAETRDEAKQEKLWELSVSLTKL